MGEDRRERGARGMGTRPGRALRAARAWHIPDAEAIGRSWRGVETLLTRGMGGEDEQ